MSPRIGVVLTQLGAGGAEKQTVELLRALRGTPHEPVLVVCLSRDLAPYGPVVREMGYPLEVLPRHGSFDVARIVRLRALLRAHGIELVHAVHLLASAYAHLACRGGGPVVLPTVRGTVVHPGWIKRRVFRAMFRAAPVILANSARGARFTVEMLGAPADRVRVVPNGVDFARLRREACPGALRAELGLPRDVPLVGFVGRDVPVKNVPRFVAVLRRLVRDDPRLHAVLAGPRLDETARALRAPDLPAHRVHFLGSRRDIPGVLTDLDVLVLTSDSEGAPNVVLEALGLGTPVVGADVGDVALMIPPGGGCVVPPPEVAAYAAAVRDVLSGGAAVRAVVSAGRPALERRYGLPGMVEGTVAAWHDALGMTERLAALP